MVNNKINNLISFQCLPEAPEGEQHRHYDVDAEHRGRDYQGTSRIELLFCLIHG